MSRQLVRAAIATAIVISVIAGVAVWYEPHDQISRADEFDRRSLSEPARVSGTIHLNDQEVYSFSLQQDETNRLTRVSFPNVTLDTFQHRPSDRSYLLVDAESDGALDRSVEQYADEPDEAVIRWDNESRDAVILDRGTGPAPDRQPPPLVYDLIAIPRYEPDGITTMNGTSVTVYRPSNEWYDQPGRFLRSDTVRVSRASGVVFVDPSTDRLVYSNVSYLATPSKTWGMYLYRRFVGEGHATEVDYRYRSGSTAIDRPIWIPDG